jgi:hypothetical protein
MAFVTQRRPFRNTEIGDPWIAASPPLATGSCSAPMAARSGAASRPRLRLSPGWRRRKADPWPRRLSRSPRTSRRSVLCSLATTAGLRAAFKAGRRRRAGPLSARRIRRPGSAKSHSLCSAAAADQGRQRSRFGSASIGRSRSRSATAPSGCWTTRSRTGLSFYESTDTEIRGKNGTLFLFNGLRTNPDAIKSTEGLDLAIVMEANKVAQRSWDLLIPTVRKPGSEIWAEWNPDPDRPGRPDVPRSGWPPPGSASSARSTGATTRSSPRC